MLELSSRELMCSCRPCSLLFDREGAGSGRYKLVPERRLRLEDFAISDAGVGGAARSGGHGVLLPLERRASGCSPTTPARWGRPSRSCELSSWQELEAANPILGELEPDVEALLVNRVARREHGTGSSRSTSATALVGLIRTRWRGL